MPTEENNVEKEAKGGRYSSQGAGMPLNSTALQQQLVIAMCDKVLRFFKRSQKTRFYVKSPEQVKLKSTATWKPPVCDPNTS